MTPSATCTRTRRRSLPRRCASSRTPPCGRPGPAVQWSGPPTSAGTSRRGGSWPSPKRPSRSGAGPATGDSRNGCKWPARHPSAPHPKRGRDDPGATGPDHPFAAEGRIRSLIPAICGEWPPACGPLRHARPCMEGPPCLAGSRSRGDAMEGLEDVDAVQAQLHRVVAAFGCGRRLDGPHHGRGVRGLGVGDEQQRPDLLAGVPRHSIPWRSSRGGVRPAPAAAGSMSGRGPGRPEDGSLRRQPLLNGIREMPDGGPAAGDGSDPHGGRQLQFLPQCQFPAGVPGRIPAQQGADPGGVVGRDDHQAALRCRPHQGRGVEPAADGVLPRPQVFPAQQRVAVEQQGRGVPAGGHGFGPDGGHHEAAVVRQRWP